MDSNSSTLSHSLWIPAVTRYPLPRSSQWHFVGWWLWKFAPALAHHITLLESSGKVFREHFAKHEKWFWHWPLARCVWHWVRVSVRVTMALARPLPGSYPPPWPLRPLPSSSPLPASQIMSDTLPHLAVQNSACPPVFLVNRARHESWWTIMEETACRSKSTYTNETNQNIFSHTWPRLVGCIPVANPTGPELSRLIWPGHTRSERDQSCQQDGAPFHCWCI